MSKTKINGLLIAAGLSERMGEFKPLMLYKDKSFVVTIVEKLLTVCERVVVVTGFQKEKIEELIKSKFSILNSQFSIRVDCVYNPNYEKGMFTSLQAGLTAIKYSDWILYHFVDQPFHEEKFYKELVNQVDNKYDWVQPVYDGKEGHPVIFRKTMFQKILTAHPSSSLRLIRDDSETKIKKWECGYYQILSDFDSKEDMQSFFLPNLP